MTRAYLDHASTSPLRPEAFEAMLPWLRGDAGSLAADPGRVHTEGRIARVTIEDARDEVAALFGCRSSREVVFTSGATEAINTAVWGATGGDTSAPAVVVCPAVEHAAVRDASARHRVAIAGVDRFGRVDPAEVVRLARTSAARLVHCQWGNHEVGTLQPVADVVAACREAGVLVHVDAAQAAGRVPIGFAELGADLLSVSAHKFGGPGGVGALLVRRGLRLQPLVVGGDQERGRRAGLEHVAGIVGFGAAAAHVRRHGVLDDERRRNGAQTDALVAAATAVEGVTAYGDPEDRLPHIACFGVEGVEAEPVLLALDQAGVAVHSGSSCSSESLEPSPVLEAMGVDAERSLRVSVGWSTTDADVDAFAAAFPEAVARLRALRT